MIGDELKYRVREALGVPPTGEQAHALDVFAMFMTDRSERVAMVLSGSAGTGKTTLASAIVKALALLGQKLVLLAPTGRAAKVFSLNAGMAAYTIHRRIYRQKTAGDLSSFNLNANLQRDTLFIIDEASMVANGGSDTFGSGRLLDDLVEFIFQGTNCRMLFVGDRAQLPPVGEEESPALSVHLLRSYGMTVYEANLNEVLRQASDSGILWNATRVRQMVPGIGTSVRTKESDVADGGADAGVADGILLPKVRIRDFPDIHVVPGDELIEQIAGSYSRAGLDGTIVITRSNKRANIYNRGIRATVLDREDELCRGDQLMIVKNNYFWTSGNKELPFLANGDVAVVQRVRHVHELYGFRFAEVTLQLPDYGDYELTATVLLDTLTSESPALTREQQEQLFQQVMADYADVPLKADRMKKIMQDAHYNALQVKFAYAVTCHKAQGGQWEHVYIDQGYMTDDMLTPDYLHWLYTAFTRATEQLFLINWPQSQQEQMAS